MRKLFCYLFLLFAATATFTACSEDDGEVDEYANWAQRNTQYWDSLYAATQQKIAAGDSTWKIVLNWSLQNQTNASESGGVSYGNTQYIIVHELNRGTGSGHPMLTDSVRVFYQGRLIPSASYSKGYIFDGTWDGEYNAASNHQATFIVNGVVDGFITALLNMNVGDRWQVFVPQNLGYAPILRLPLPCSHIVHSSSISHF